MASHACVSLLWLLQKHCKFSLGENCHFYWRAALIQASPRTTQTPAIPCGDPQAASGATSNKDSFITGAPKPIKMHMTNTLALPNPLYMWSRVQFLTLKYLLCMWTSSLLPPHGQLGSREKSCQMDKKGNMSERDSCTFFPPSVLHTCRHTQTHKHYYRVFLLVVARVEKVQNGES